MGLFDSNDPGSPSVQQDNERRIADITESLGAGRVPSATRLRLQETRNGRLPWLATLTPAELTIVRSHGLRPIAAVSATCWIEYSWSWTEGHAQGWQTALTRLREEAREAGANAVLDVKMRTIPLGIESSMDFTLVGTAVRVEGLPPSTDPVVATVPALELVKLLEADVVPTGIAVGAQYDWLNDWKNTAVAADWLGNALGNVEASVLTQFWEAIRKRAHAELRKNAAGAGNGVLAQVNFSQLFEVDRYAAGSKQYLGRHIVVATTVDARPNARVPHEIKAVVDMRAGASPPTGTTLTGARRHHQSYASNEREGAI